MFYTKEEIRKDLGIAINESTIKKEIETILTGLLDKMGLYYRCFSRLKSPESIEKKLKIKNYTTDRRMQDIFGVRIVLYYRDDVNIVLKQIEKNFDVVDIARNVSLAEKFSSEKLNIVCRFPQNMESISSKDFFEKYNIDTTFEIQIRTVFSEGWHEVEHDMRYKCEDSWKEYEDYLRVLYGIFATLNTCDWAMVKLFSDLAHDNYKSGQWDDMIRNKFRIKMKDGKLSENIKTLFDEDHELAKAIYRYDRERLMDILYNMRFKFSLTADTIVQLINLDIDASEKLKEKTNATLREKFVQSIQQARKSGL
ncbi:MAG: hypothetical protein ACLRTT_12705 [Lachnospiraceae bacterium]